LETNEKILDSRRQMTMEWRTIYEKEAGNPIKTNYMV
jgi:hypothetical protein